MLVNLQTRLHSVTQHEHLPTPQESSSNVTAQSRPYSTSLGSRIVCGSARLWSFLGVNGASTTHAKATHFFAALTAPYKPVPLPSIANNRPRRTLRDDVRHTREPADRRPRATPKPDARALSLRDIPLYVPDEPWAWLRGCHIENRRVLQRLETGGMCPVSLMSGTVNGRPITYINKSWSLATQHAWRGFFSELALYKGSNYLRPLQGDVIPRLLSVQVDGTSASFIMELPHNSFWIEASDDMPPALKARCIAALRKIHSHGVVHGDIQLRHLLIGGDGRVTVINFQESRACEPMPKVGLQKAEAFEFAMECRRLEYKLDYGNARETERRRYTKAYQRWEAKHYRESRLPHNDETDLSAQSEDDIQTPPPSRRAWETKWAQPVSQTPARVVVPGQTEERLQAAVDSFLRDLESAGGSGSQGSAHQTIPVSLAHPRTPATRKRKSPSDHELELPPPKRVQVSEADGKASIQEAHDATESVTCSASLSSEAPLPYLTPPRTPIRSSGGSKRKREEELPPAQCETPVKKRKFYCVDESPKGTVHALGRDFLQLRKGKERYRFLDSREFFQRQAQKPRSRAVPGRGILKPARPTDDPSSPDLEAKSSEELDSIINQAIAQAIQSERPTRPSDPPSALKKSKRVVEAEQAAKDRARFQRRFSGRPVIAGGAGVGFAIPSIAQAYSRGYARKRRICHPRNLLDTTPTRRRR